MLVTTIKGGGASYDASFMHPDHLGTPVAATRTNGTLRWRKDYTPFGEQRLNDPGVNEEAGFTGHIEDSATGLTYMQARYYDPIIGRFYATDPIGYQDQLNLYAYVGNDPINATDPTGLATCANDDCSKAYIDSEINQGPAPIDSSLQGDPNARTATVTFNNDDPNGASSNQPVDTTTALTVEAGIRESGVSSVNINSTTGGTHSATSRHASGQAVDINRVNGKRVDDPSNAGAVADLQGALANQSNIRENFGPALNQKTTVGGSGFGTTTDMSGNARIVSGHRNHIHASTHRRAPTALPPNPRIKP